MVRKVLPDKLTFEQRPKGVKGMSQRLSGIRAFQGKRKASAKTLGLEHAGIFMKLKEVHAAGVE